MPLSALTLLLAASVEPFRPARLVTPNPSREAGELKARLIEQQS